jgi:hypothetical protein
VEKGRKRFALDDRLFAFLEYLPCSNLRFWVSGWDF